MRPLVLLLLLACGFGLAALWQSQRLDGLRAERELATRISEGEFSETSSGLVPAGAAVVVIGTPSGAAPLEGAREEEPVHDAGDFEHPTLPDFEMRVGPGQTLTKIATTHYGQADAALVKALARYNGLEDPDLLHEGDELLLPPVEKLER